MCDPTRHPLLTLDTCFFVGVADTRVTITSESEGLLECSDHEQVALYHPHHILLQLFLL
jgi:hypothetical protein